MRLQSLQYIEFNEFDGRVLIVVALLPTQPHLQVIRGGLWQLLAEPGRLIELTA